jgi:hypothetical protein
VRAAVLAGAVLFAACKPKAPVAAPAPAPAPAPAAAPDLSKGNAAERYVGALQGDVKKAQEAADKANAAVKASNEANKVSE